MPRTTGGNAQDRRRTRRAVERRQQMSERAATPEILSEFAALVAAASGSTTLPLSERDHAWDASAAETRVRDWADAADGPNAKYASAFFWKASGAENFGDFKLGFADVVAGELTAVWAGVTAVAAVLQGGRGGVDIPAGDRDGVKAKVASYYAKAAKQYEDDTIEVPWKSGDSESAVSPEELALEALDVFASTVMCAGCGHPYSEHAGAAGTCSHEDGRGTCSCAQFAEADADALVAAAGDVKFGPEEGFVDLLCDINEALGGGSGGDDGDSPYVANGARAIDVAVGLDKALIVDYSDDCSHWVAPITIDKNGEPIVSTRDKWAPVDGGWIETPPDDDTVTAASFGNVSAGNVRFLLRDLVTWTGTDNIVLADGATTPMIPDAHKPTERLPRRKPPVDLTPPPSDLGHAGPTAWEATFVPEGTLTDDGRAFAPNSLTWRELPLTLMAMIETSAHGHDGATVSGRIDNIWREGSLVKASGVFDDGEFGQDISRMVADGVLRGLSVDIAIHQYEVGPRSDYFAEDGSWLPERPVRAEADDPSLADLLFGGDDEDQVFVVTEGVIGMATVCPFPAFADASIALAASGAIWQYAHQAGMSVVRMPVVASAVTEEEEVETESVEPRADAPLSVVAAGLAPLHPPAEWFENPELEELTPLTVTEDGRIFGHAWAWETCHIAYPDACVSPPHSETANAYFHLGEIECENGELVSVGKITIDAPHAGQRLSRMAATAHYDHTGTVAAHVVSGEDEFGGWFSGAIHPEISEEKLRLLRGATPSGDWRNMNGNLELIALLAVNVPGFPVPRTRALVAAGDDGQEVLALTAAGIFDGQDRTPEEDADEVAALALQALAVEALG